MRLARTLLVALAAGSIVLIAAAGLLRACGSSEEGPAGGSAAPAETFAGASVEAPGEAPGPPDAGPADRAGLERAVAALLDWRTGLYSPLVSDGELQASLSVLASPAAVDATYADLLADSSVTALRVKLHAARALGGAPEPLVASVPVTMRLLDGAGPDAGTPTWPNL